MINNNLLKEDETIDDLQINNLYIIQKRNGYKFGTDPVLLTNFAHIRKFDFVVDFGTGTGIIPILMSAKYPLTKFAAFEIQNEMAEMAQRSIILNNLEDIIKIYNEDLVNANKIIGNELADFVVCNPPYGKINSTLLNKNQNKRFSKHEYNIGLEDIIESAFKILRYGGKLAMCIPSARLLELMNCFQKFNIEPKRLLLVQSYIHKAPYLALLEGVKGGRSGLHILKPLIIYNEDRSMSDEAKIIYNKKTS
ncbi:MAG: methyltransferase [Christensenellaceae bacterium]|nr:methyltransferase [Christensenellaceae bacterium]